MSERVTMPALGESVTEGTVTRWLKSVGDTIEVDEPLLEVSTDKVDTEIPSPVAGTLQEILVGEDDTVPVGADLAVIGDGAGGGSEQPAAEAPAAEAPAEQAAEQSAEQSAAGSAPASSAGEAPAAGQSGGSGEGTTVTMPALGESVTEGTVTRWLKAEGDQVEVDEPLLEVSTDKVDTEIPSPVAGTLSKILVGEDETVPVGADLAVVGGSGAGAARAAG
jgi:2-oxoglutarate dehydrogenase E2 component (dihydrolipoamide succinyltransferase)